MKTKHSLNLNPARSVAFLVLVGASSAMALDPYLQNVYRDADFRQRGLFEGLGGDSSDESMTDQSEFGKGVVEEESWKDLFHFSLAGGVRYDDNIFLSNSNQEDDLIISVSPTLSVRSGAEGTAQNSYSLSYTPSFLFFTDHSDQNTIDHRASFRFTKQLPKSKIAFVLDYTDTNGSDRFVSGQVARTRWNASLNYNYLMTEKTRLDLTATTDIDTFKQSGLHDRRNYAIRGSVLYQLTGKTSIGPSFRYGYTDITGSNNQDAYELGLKAEYQATGKTALTGTLGYNVRSFDGSNTASNQNDISWAIGARYAATAKTSLRALFYREPRISYNFQNSGYMATGLSLQASHTLTPRINLYGVISYEDDSYYRTDKNMGVNFDHDYFTATMGANYQMANGFTVGGNMTWRSNSSENSFNEYDSFSCGLNASYNFW